MRLSPLQKYILLECLNAKSLQINRVKLGKFYDKRKKKPKQKLMTKIITQSLERLINKVLQFCKIDSLGHLLMNYYTKVLCLLMH